MRRYGHHGLIIVQPTAKGSLTCKTQLQNQESERTCSRFVDGVLPRACSARSLLATVSQRRRPHHHRVGFHIRRLRPIALCLITSRLMLTDTVRPPSRKKKNHLWLKWASGAALAACAAPHALGWDASARWFTLLVLALLAWHAYIGCKSLARDLRCAEARRRLRIAIIAASLRHRSHRCSIADQRRVAQAKYDRRRPDQVAGRVRVRQHLSCRLRLQWVHPTL